MVGTLENLGGPLDNSITGIIYGIISVTMTDEVIAYVQYSEP